MMATGRERKRWERTHAVGTASDDGGNAEDEAERKKSPRRDPKRGQARRECKKKQWDRKIKAQTVQLKEGEICGYVRSRQKKIEPPS